jgi:integrase
MYQNITSKGTLSGTSIFQLVIDVPLDVPNWTKMAKLNTDTKYKNAKPKDKAYTIIDGQGMHLLIKPTGAKMWEFRYTSPTTKKRKKISLGSYPNTELVIARNKRYECLKLIAEGIDPSEQRTINRQEILKKENSNFKLLAEQWLEFESKRTSPQTHKRKKAIIENDAYPFLQNKSINDINHQDIINTIKARLTKKITTADNNKNAPDGIETANKLYNYINTIFKYAITIGIANYNPFNDILKDLIIPKPDVTHHPKITENTDLKKLIKDIYSYKGHYSTVNALKLALHIPLRAENLANLLWEYIDFENKSLTIPRELMKNKNKNLPDFKVPLTDAVISILQEQLQYTSHQKYVFLSVAGKPIHSNTPNMALTRMGYKNKQTLHGFRGIYRSLADTHQKEHNSDYDTKRRFLDHHDDNKVEKAYNHRAEHFEQMKPLVKWWSHFINKLI